MPEDFDSLLGMIEVRLRARVSARIVSGELTAGNIALHIKNERKLFVDSLFRVFEALHNQQQEPIPEPQRRPSPAPEVVVDGAPPMLREEPTTEILDKARKLQTLALRTTNENERANAWFQFEKLWQRYKLPNNL